MRTATFACCALLAASALAPPAYAQAPAIVSGAPAAAAEPIGGTLADGTRWQVLKPANWNGTLLLDLDGAGNARPATGTGAPPVPGGAFTQWLLAQGYAYGGVQREPVGYDFPRAVDYLIGVRESFIARWGKPRRTLATGGSRGAFVVRKALELRGDVFDGGFLNSGGGAGEIAVLNNKLNALFVLKTLVDPASAMKLVGVDAQADAVALTELVRKANATPQGRARLGLAAAVQQFSLWSTRGKPKPAPFDYDGQLDQIAENFVFATAVPVRAGVERVAGGNVSWNTGVDYAALLRLSGRTAMVEALYAKAGIGLADDLATLARAPRIKADPAAVRRAEPLMTYTGKISDPLVNVDNDDPVDPASDKLVYLDTLKAAGTDGLFRLIWTDLPGHGGQSNLDRAVGFTLLIDRLDRGRWGDTSLPTLRKLGEQIARSSPVDLGQLTVFDPGKLAPAPNRWDARNWRRYTGK